MRNMLKKMSVKTLKTVRAIMIALCIVMVMTALSIYDGPVLAVIAILFTVGGFCWITAVVDYEIHQELENRKE